MKSFPILWKLISLCFFQLNYLIQLLFGFILCVVWSSCALLKIWRRLFPWAVFVTEFGKGWLPAWRPKIGGAKSRTEKCIFHPSASFRLIPVLHFLSTPKMVRRVIIPHLFFNNCNTALRSNLAVGVQILWYIYAFHAPWLLPEVGAAFT